jgi:tetratricopeptide (TPR) repeat protein
MLENLIRFSYPYPISATYQNIESILYPDEMPYKYNRIIDLYDSILKTLSYYLLGYAAHAGEMGAGLKSQLDATLKNPTPANWTNLLEHLLESLKGKRESLVQEAEAFYYGQGQSLARVRDAVMFMLSGPTPAADLSRVSVAHFFKSYNVYISQAARPDFDYEKAVDIFFPAFREVLLNLRFLKDYALVYVSSIMVEGKSFDHNLEVMSGIAPVKKRFASDTPVSQGNRRLYVFQVTGEELRPRFTLHPFVVVHPCSLHGKDEIYYLRYRKEDELDYYCFQCRERLRPERLLLDFRDAMSAIDSGRKGAVTDEILDLYREALETVWRDGVITGDEREKLESLREHFGISRDTAAALEEDVKRKKGIAGSQVSLQELRRFEELVRSSIIKGAVPRGLRGYIERLGDSLGLTRDYAARIESRIWMEEGRRLEKAGCSEAAGKYFGNARATGEMSAGILLKIPESSRFAAESQPPPQGAGSPRSILEAPREGPLGPVLTMREPVVKLTESVPPLADSPFRPKGKSKIIKVGRPAQQAAARDEAGPAPELSAGDGPEMPGHEEEPEESPPTMYQHEYEFEKDYSGETLDGGGQEEATDGYDSGDGERDLFDSRDTGSLSGDAEEDASGLDGDIQEESFEEDYDDEVPVSKEPYRGALFDTGDSGSLAGEPFEQEPSPEEELPSQEEEEDGPGEDADSENSYGRYSDSYFPNGLRRVELSMPGSPTSRQEEAGPSDSGDGLEEAVEYDGDEEEIVPPSTLEIKEISRKLPQAGEPPAQDSGQVEPAGEPGSPAADEEEEEDGEDSVLSRIPPLDTVSEKRRGIYKKVMTSKLNAAKQYIQLGKFGRACAILDEIVRIDSRNLVARLLRSKCAMENGDFEEALSDLDLIMKFKKDDIGLMSMHGKAAFEGGRLDLAMSDFNHIIMKDPANMEAFLQRGAVFIELGNFDRAIDDFQVVIRNRPDDPEAYVNRGACWMEKDEFELALKDFQKASRLAPDDAYALSQQGQVYSAMGDSEKAVRIFDRAIRIDPEEADYYLGRSAALSALERFDEALGDIRKAVEMQPDSLEAFYRQGRILEFLERDEEASGSYGTMIEIEGGAAQGHALRGRLLASRGRHEEALSDYNESIGYDPDNPETLFFRGSALLELDRLDEAIADFDEALSIDPVMPEALLHRSRAYRKKGDMERAAEDHQRYEELTASQDEAD